ncbi:MAG: hypothetical protein HN742_29860 [Lentisphaerae bacterium]|jgi:hypothetical protein|nr:hypothetical protein [Lentisphaerota bacterium]MBT4817902.1 hypothetical protein [Lentisphaerota bacterium]MBT5608294.1 hypothetical protein [Lentisphaerota bacterium]MBT7061806.1 hypothetical protein [Lentisphaerota bacterium]MBT7846115.1 hypothetical protein [Lentisphaerota bacterium]
MQFGFAKTDITPRVGVDLCGFGPFINRYSVGVRDRLRARAMAVSDGETTAVLVSCDLVGVNLDTTHRVREIVAASTCVPADHVLVHCTHTHSGPATVTLNGWGRRDPPYMEILPARIADACVKAVEGLADTDVRHACVPCEGIGLNREYDRDAPALNDVLQDSWRPAKPELTDTVCHVFQFERAGKLVGFVSYFGCHPVVCCASTRWIHGDWCGVATGLIEGENGEAVGLFLQGAQGDVNSCVVHKPEAEALAALDVVAERYARAVRRGLAEGQSLDSGKVAVSRHEVVFTRTDLSRSVLTEWLTEAEAVLHASGAQDDDRQVRMSMVHTQALRGLLARIDRGESLQPVTEVHGLRFGPVTLLCAPFEIFQGIKNRVVSEASAPLPLVVGLTNDLCGYAPDWERGGGDGYAAKTVPLITGQLPFADIATELTRELLALDASLAG